jgi:hypothetical protein
VDAIQFFANFLFKTLLKKKQANVLTAIQYFLFSIQLFDVARVPSELRKAVRIGVERPTALIHLSPCYTHALIKGTSMAANYMHAFVCHYARVSVRQPILQSASLGLCRVDSLKVTQTAASSRNLQPMDSSRSSSQQPTPTGLLVSIDEVTGFQAISGSEIHTSVTATSSSRWTNGTRELKQAHAVLR